MSLLGTQVYANPDTSCWVSANGGTITGTLVVDNLDVTGSAQVAGIIVDNGQVFPTQALLELGAGANIGMEMSSPGGIGGQINTNDNIYFGRKGTNGGSTFITPGAAPNTDTMTVGGVLTTTGVIVSPSVTPTLVNYAGAFTITQNAAPLTLPTFGTPFPVVSGQEYDIQITGYWGIGAGVCTPATGDKASIVVRTGSGTLPAFLQYQCEDLQYPANPEDVWAAASFRPFNIRARLGANITAPMALVAEFSGTGVYPGSAATVVIQNCDVTRVK